MSYMKLVAQMSHDKQTTLSSFNAFKAALLRAQSKGDSYVIYQGEIWTPEQVEGIIALLSKKVKEYDTLHRSEESNDSE